MGLSRIYGAIIQVLFACAVFLKVCTGDPFFLTALVAFKPQEVFS